MVRQDETKLIIDIGQHTLQECRVSLDEVFRRIQVIELHLGQTVIEKISRRGILDTDDLSLILERSDLLDALSGKVGFRAVTSKISRSGSLLEPEAEWFQLRIGGILARTEPDVAFEQDLNGAPKDLLLRRDTIHIECKSFVLAPAAKDIYDAHAHAFAEVKRIHPDGAWWIQIDRDSRDGDPIREVVQIFRSSSIDDLRRYPAGEKGFVITVGPTASLRGSLPKSVVSFGVSGVDRLIESSSIFRPYSQTTDGALTVSFSGPLLDQTNKFESAIIDKKRQMVPGICNIIALDVDDFTGDFSSLEKRLQGLFQPGRNKDISAFLLIGFRAEQECSVVANVDVMTNPHAEVVAPADLVEALNTSHTI
jgi:hypothetical protein